MQIFLDFCATDSEQPKNCHNRYPAFAEVLNNKYNVHDSELLKRLCILPGRDPLIPGPGFYKRIAENYLGLPDEMLREHRGILAKILKQLPDTEETMGLRVAAQLLLRRYRWLQELSKYDPDLGAAVVAYGVKDGKRKFVYRDLTDPDQDTRDHLLYECATEELDSSLRLVGLTDPEESFNLDLSGSMFGMNITEIPAYFGSGNPYITKIEFPESLVSVGPGAFTFGGCSNLISVSIPKGVTDIGYGAFKGCGSLKDITIPDTVRSIGGSAFDGTPFLESQPAGLIYGGRVVIGYRGTDSAIAIPEGVTGIGAGAFEGAETLTSVIIPDSVMSIGPRAFKNCRSLTAVSIPEGVESIGYSTFEGCSNLTEVSIPQSVVRIGAHAFKGTPWSKTKPPGLKFGGRVVVGYTGDETSITIPEGVTGIAENAFAGCKSLTSITIPEGVTEIAENAFGGCKNLTSITIPDSVKRIGPFAFFHCVNLISVTIPEGVTSIEEYSFFHCKSLISVTIPKGVKGIGEGAFSRCSSLENVTIPEGVVSIGKSAFAGCNNLKTVRIPKSVEFLGEYSFDTITENLYRIREVNNDW